MYVPLVYEWHQLLNQRAAVQQLLDEARAEQREIKTAEEGLPLKIKIKKLSNRLDILSDRAKTVGMRIPNLPYTSSHMAFTMFLQARKDYQEEAYKRTAAFVKRRYLNPLSRDYAGAKGHWGRVCYTDASQTDALKGDEFIIARPHRRVPPPFPKRS